MPDVTVKAIDEMETLFDGVARRARAELGVTAWGMQVMTLPPDWDGYPNHEHGPGAEEAGQEEVYIPLTGSATLVADDETFELRPGVMARVAPQQRRRILPGRTGSALSPSAESSGPTGRRRGRSSAARGPCRLPREPGHRSAARRRPAGR